jgi:hypothetical protein
MTNPDDVIWNLNAEIMNASYDGNAVLEKLLIEARDMIRTLRKERDESEAANFILGYN